MVDSDVNCRGRFDSTGVLPDMVNRPPKAINEYEPTIFPDEIEDLLTRALGQLLECVCHLS